MFMYVDGNYMLNTEYAVFKWDVREQHRFEL
jgi:hypothetical protein